MKACMLVANPFLTKNFIDSRILNEIKNLIENGIEIDVICTGPAEKPTQSIADRININRIISKESMLYNGVYFPLLASIKLLVKNEQYKIIHAHNPPDHLIFSGYFFKIMNRILRKKKVSLFLDMHDPVVTAVDSYDLFRRFPQFLSLTRLFERLSLRIADKIIVVSKGSKERLISLGVDEDKIIVLRNYVDVSLFNHKNANPERIKRKFNIQNKKIILYTGAIKEFRGLDKLIKAFSLISEEFPELVVLMPGKSFEGYATELEKLATSLNLKDRVILPGLLPYQEMPSFIAAADICAIPTDDTKHTAIMGNPNKLYQYMVMKKPILGTKIESITEFIDDSSAFLVNPGDIESMANALKILLTDTVLSKKIAEKAYNLAIEKYDWEKQIGKLLDIYRVKCARSPNLQ
ncbi:glycosyltransferase family 4 protein [[Eubacterium] cellulosolvens]